MAMGGDDAGREAEVGRGKGTEFARGLSARRFRSEAEKEPANGGCRVTQWSDRLSAEELAPQTVSRPFLAVSRRLPGVDAVVDTAAGAKLSGGAPHIGARGGVSVADG